jgi:nickel/cobalt transporter (NiCoT) family protein
MNIPAVSSLSIGNRNGVRRNVASLFSILLAGNLAAWTWALLAFHNRPVLLGTALLAYSFGLRHAFDADHIAAIDNVTRKLMQEGQRPLGAGLFFSLGHSTIVVALSIAIAATATLLAGRFDALKDVGGVIGTTVSSLFLIVIGLANLVVLMQVAGAFRIARDGGAFDEEHVDRLLSQRGFFSRIFQRLFALISKSWHMYPLGVLFGLGFDTATEIGLLGISATQATQGMSIWAILIFPALFTAGMSLMDTADSALMLGAYGWAFVKPVRKLYYNMTITFVSVVVALVIGGIEALGLIADKLALQGPFWDTVAALGDNFGLIGYGIVALFVASWIVSWAIYRFKGYDRLDVAAS